MKKAIPYDIIPKEEMSLFTEMEKAYVQAA